MSQPRVVVLGYGSGNVRSAVRALERVGAQVELTARAEAVQEADGLVVPGVGAFAAVMDQLRGVDAPRLIERRLAGGRPVLGICVGMQVMFESSTEHTEPTEHASSSEQAGSAAAEPQERQEAALHGAAPVPGLAQWSGTVSRLQASVVPHMGWSQVAPPQDSILFDGLENQRFYFVHSYAAKTDPSEGMGVSATRLPQVTWAHHGEDFVAAVENGALCATQFHPEKSGDAGAQLLRNWLTTL